jgi:hypothetical protein
MIIAQMSKSFAPSAKLCALPDDLLRAMAAFVPTSGLLGLVQCSRRFAAVLHDELTSSLNGLFVRAQPGVIWKAFSYHIVQLSAETILALFFPGQTYLWCTLNFVEAEKLFDGSPCYVQYKLTDPMPDTHLMSTIDPVAAHRFEG